jgi:Family of unknown function (DUF6521)
VTSLLPWIQDNREQLVDFAQRVQRLRPITREALLFGLQHQTLMLTAEGDVAIGLKRVSATERRTGLFTDETPHVERELDEGGRAQSLLEKKSGPRRN